MNLNDYDSMIALGGSLPIILIFVVINRKIFNLKGKIGLPAFIYVISVFTGGYSIDLLGMSNLQSAVIAGLWAPLFYTTFTTVLIRTTPKHFLGLFRNTKYDWLNDDSDLIDGFNFEDEE